MSLVVLNGRLIIVLLALNVSWISRNSQIFRRKYIWYPSPKTAGNYSNPSICLPMPYIYNWLIRPKMEYCLAGVAQSSLSTFYRGFDFLASCSVNTIFSALAQMKYLPISKPFRNTKLEFVMQTVMTSLFREMMWRGIISFCRADDTMMTTIWSSSYRRSSITCNPYHHNLKSWDILILP